jgi:hypothetical protein
MPAFGYYVLDDMIEYIIISHATLGIVDWTKDEQPFTVVVVRLPMTTGKEAHDVPNQCFAWANSKIG